MLTGCRPNVPPPETAKEMTDGMTNGQPDSTDTETKPDTVPRVLLAQKAALPYTVTTAHQAIVSMTAIPISVGKNLKRTHGKARVGFRFFFLP